MGVRQSSATGELSNSIRASFNPGRLLVLLGTGRINHRGRNACYAPTQRRSLVSPSKRFSELQDEFSATSKRLRLAQTAEDKLALLNELQRIVQESKRALVDTEPRKQK